MWKAVKNYEWIYEVSKLWEVKRLIWIQSTKEYFLALHTNKRWYVQVRLSKKNKRETFSVHRLVMQVFHWKSDLQVNHKNWIKTDNRLVNLEYCTASENVQHRFKVLWHKWNSWAINWMYGKFWEKHPTSKKVLQFDLDWNFIKEFWSIKEVTNSYNINQSSISNACAWRKKTAIGFIWKYKTNI